MKRLINRRSVQALRSTDSTTTVAQEPPKKEPAKPKREAALKSKDDGKFFSESAWKQVQPAADKLFKEKKIDLLVETFKDSPKGDIEKLKAMTAAEREKFFKEYVSERSKEVDLTGIYVFVCRNPAFLWVGVSNSLATKLPSGFGSIVSQPIVEPVPREEVRPGTEGSDRGGPRFDRCRGKGEEVTGLVLSDDLIFVSRDRGDREGGGPRGPAGADERGTDRAGRQSTRRPA